MHVHSSYQDWADLAVVALDELEVRLDEWQVLALLKESDSARGVKARSKHRKEIVDQSGLVVKVELQSL